MVLLALNHSRTCENVHVRNTASTCTGITPMKAEIVITTFGPLRKIIPIAAKLSRVSLSSNP